ncbi:MAG: FAD binding domain-containing protein [Burkholderiaceae bacterium]|nr:FAD binding domain-containing protein [Burkholderiaceae bacterium]
MTTQAQTAFRRALSLDAALAALAAGPCTVLAGGTDLYAGSPASPGAPPLLDIGSLDTLRRIETCAFEDRPAIRVGALATWSALRDDGLPPWARALAIAARDVGGVQIQNRGTLGGNVCNASPAADGVPALLALDAQVELARQGARRRMPLSRFLLGPRRTAREADELVTGFVLPVPPAQSRSTFLKLGSRRYLVISIAMVAMAIDVGDDRRIAAARLAVGACGPVASRLGLLESRLTGLALPLAPDVLARLIDDDTLAPLRPIDDVRGGASYRRDAVTTLLARGLAEVTQEALA